MAKNNCSLDTNALLDWLFERESSRASAIDSILDTYREVHVADIVISELAFVLEKVYKFSRDATVLNLRRVIEDERINCNRNLFAKAIPLFEQRAALSIIDCCAVYYASFNDALPLFTSDKKLVNQSEGLAKLIK